MILRTTKKVGDKYFGHIAREINTENSVCIIRESDQFFQSIRISIMLLFGLWSFVLLLLP